MTSAVDRGPVCAAIDIGTNTLLVLVGSVDQTGRVHVRADHADITRLGAGVDRTGELHPDAMDRALDALARAVALARLHGAVRIGAVATSAVREARNREHFLARARGIAGVGDDLDVRAIDGAEEASLTFHGVDPSGFFPRETHVLAFDIGGGSTELVAGATGSDAVFAHSLPLGSVRLTERLLAHAADPPEATALDALAATVDQALATVGPAPACAALVGLAATVTTLSAVAHGSTVSPWLSHTDLARTLDRLATLPLAVRRTVPGLDPRRADVIVAGGVIAERIVRWSGASGLRVSDGGVRTGLLRRLCAS